MEPNGARPIVAQSGWGQNHDKMLASEAGFNHHLTKPITLRNFDFLQIALKHGCMVQHFVRSIWPKIT
jgi:CheY-like chemotaxis protein